jgi:hypothetical protein
MHHVVLAMKVPFAQYVQNVIIIIIVIITMINVYLVLASERLLIHFRQPCR